MNKYRLLVIICTIFFSCNSEINLINPDIEEGILDLSEWDFTINKYVSLNGKSEFYWKKILYHSDFKANEQKPDGLIQLPGIWNNFKINNKEIGSKGFASYRFKIKLKELTDELSFKFQNINSAYNVYVDNKKITSVGKFATSIKNAIPSRIFQIVSFKPSKKEFDVIFHISNFNSNFAGFCSKIYFGKKHDLQFIRESKLIINFFLFGCIFIMFVYHLSLYFIRKSDKSTLFFSLGCFFMAVYTLNSGEIFLFDIFPVISWSYSAKMMFISAYMSLAMFAYFMYYIFTKETKLLVVHAVNIFCIICSTLTLFSSMITMITIMKVFCVFITIWTIYFTKIIIQALRNRSEGAMIYVLTSIVFIGTIINDVLVGFNVMNSGFLIPFGILGFIFSQAFLISKRYSRAYTMVSNLSSDLENKNLQLNDLNQNLEEIVKDRTEELSSAMDEMEAINNALEETNSALIKAQENTLQEMKLANYVQKSLFPGSPPRVKNWDIAFEFKPMTRVSGDLFDFYIEDNVLKGMNMSDVSGHGVASGLITMIARSAFTRNFNTFKELPLNKILEIINKDLIKEIDNVDFFLSSILLRFNDDEVEYVNAGHTSLLCKRASTGKVEIIDDENIRVRGRYLGSSLLSDTYNQMSFKLEKNDTLFIYSDCIIESKNKFKEEYKEKRLIDIIKKTNGVASSEMLNLIIKDLYNFVGSTDLNDDLTLIVMKYLG